MGGANDPEVAGGRLEACSPTSLCVSCTPTQSLGSQEIWIPIPLLVLEVPSSSGCSATTLKMRGLGQMVSTGPPALPSKTV